MSSVPAASERSIDPNRYFEHAEPHPKATVESDPVCLYLETTNRCNLLCTTCPRIFEDLEPPADMSWELFTHIVDQFPRIARVVLHGVGEPMLVKELPRMIRYLKERGTYVLFNTNGTLLTLKKGRELIETGLDELRVSLDAADAPSFEQVRGRDYFARIVRHLRAFHGDAVAGGRRAAARLPVAHRPARNCGAAAGVRAPRPRPGRARGLPAAPGLLCGCAGSGAAGFGTVREPDEGASRIHAGGAVARRPARHRLQRLGRNRARHQPAPAYQRSAVVAVPATVDADVLHRARPGDPPCCIAPFSLRGYENFTLGDATQQTLREIWNGEAYQDFRRRLLSDDPPPSCTNCGLRWSL